MRSCQEVLPRPAEPKAAGSKMDVSVAKAGPVRNDGNTSAITHLRRKKELLHRGDCAHRREE